MRGGDLLDRVEHRVATEDELKSAEAVVSRTAASMGREMVPGVAELLGKIWRVHIGMRWPSAA